MRSLDKWLAGSWALVVLGLLTVRWFDVTALGRVLSVRAVMLLTILLAVVSMARDPLFRPLLLLAFAASLLMLGVTVVWFDPPFSDRELIMESAVPSMGYAVLGLWTAKAVSSSMGEKIGHPTHCDCGSLDQV